MSDVRALGQRVAAVQDQDRQLMGGAEQARQSFIRSLRRQSANPKTLLLAASVFGILGLTTTLLFVWNHPITVTVGDARPAVGIGASITAPPDREVPLRFSDGSVVSLSPGGEASIASLERNGGTLGILQGHAGIRIVHNPNTHWAVQAGPYTVTVTGTRFDVDWRPSIPQLIVTLSQGNVVVSDHAQPIPARLSEGQQLVVLRDTWTIRNSSEPPPSQPVAPASLPTPAASGDAPVAAESEPPSATQTVNGLVAARGVPGRNWSALAAHGEYRGAYELVEQNGFEHVCRASTSAELLSLAEVSRFAGHADRALQALQILRIRYAGSGDAALAAFQLGRLTTGGHQAASWFRIYLQEQKGGELAREASGRLLEALSRAGDHAGARVVARDYLKLYPQGPHAGFAQKLLNLPNQ